MTVYTYTHDGNTAYRGILIEECINNTELAAHTLNVTLEQMNSAIRKFSGYGTELFLCVEKGFTGGGMLHTTANISREPESATILSIDVVSKGTEQLMGFIYDD